MKKILKWILSWFTPSNDSLCGNPECDGVLDFMGYDPELNKSLYSCNKCDGTFVSL
jgi:hypothetical protein